MRFTIPAILPMLFACGDKDDTAPPEYDPEATICGRVVFADDSGCDESVSLPGTVDVISVLDGERACAGGDTAWIEWEDEVVDHPEVQPGGWFESFVGAGLYGIEGRADYCDDCEGVTVEEGAACSEVTLVLRNPPAVDAPNVYLYPEEPTLVSVRLRGRAKDISASDPPYGDGWEVMAHPDGLLETPWGERDYLFYELGRYDRFQRDEGWCVDGGLAVDDMAAVLEAMGFLPGEVDDFVEFWDLAWTVRRPVTVYPQLWDLPQLRISPAPDHLARVWFAVEAGCQPGLDEPVFPVTERVGYHAAEWGLAVLPPLPGANVFPWAGE
jgi:hypothetical protein